MYSWIDIQALETLETKRVNLKSLKCNTSIKDRNWKNRVYSKWPEKEKNEPHDVQDFL